MAASTKKEAMIFPFHGWIGFVLVALFWPLNWFLAGNRTLWGFFPLWFGYSLGVDALVHLRKGNSLLTRNPLAWGGLFFVSAPVWWLFELLNLRTQNWVYLGTEDLSAMQYALFSTWNFSTVMPAVFGTAELVRCWKPIARLAPGPAIPKTPAFLNGLIISGLLMLFLMLIWPDIFFPFLWVSLCFVIEPLNLKLGNRSLLRELFCRDWRTLLSLAAGALICGFFWELWNFYSFPKWIYRLPYAGGWPVFEMPLAGYLGYIPFSIELFSLYNLLTMPLRKNKLRSEIIPI